ncbi:MAG: ABC transporter permease, partial [Burkholderiales bacterium]|nr:ABC transporter permease [Anaerolineae bacterium]
MVEVIEVKKQRRGFWVRFWRLPRAWVGAALVGLVLAGAVFTPLLASADPLEQFRDGLSDLGTPLPPSAEYIMGTDHLGRD